MISTGRPCFAWKSPRFCPQALRIHCTAHFDNSENNPANPDPTKEVHWGDQTWDEMLIGWIDYHWDKPDEKAQPGKDGAGAR